MLLTPRLRDAFLWVFELDADHLRKGTEIPYLAHLLSVCALVLYAGGDEDQACAALLHDTLEDHPTAVSAASLEQRFGKKVADLVAALSDTPADYRGGEKPEWRTRKEVYLRKLSQEGPEVMLVSAADKLDNARAILNDFRQVGSGVWARFKRGREEQLWYFGELLKIYRRAGMDNFIVRELARTLSQLEQET